MVAVLLLLPGLIVYEHVARRNHTVLDVFGDEKVTSFNAIKHAHRIHFNVELNLRQLP